MSGVRVIETDDNGNEVRVIAQYPDPVTDPWNDEVAHLCSLEWDLKNLKEHLENGKFPEEARPAIEQALLRLRELIERFKSVRWNNPGDLLSDIERGLEKLQSYDRTPERETMIQIYQEMIERCKASMVKTAIPSPQSDQWLDIHEVAQRTGYSITTLRRWDQAGTLRATRSGPRGHRRYRASDVDKYIKTLTADPTARKHSSSPVASGEVEPNQRLSDSVTQSTTFAIPTIPPKSNSVGIEISGR